jgi:hypothetical protein
LHQPSLIRLFYASLAQRTRASAILLAGSSPAEKVGEGLGGQAVRRDCRGCLWLNGIRLRERCLRRKEILMTLSRTLWIGGALAIVAAVIVVIAVFEAGGGTGGY